ncbi:family 20 glycosylhydrolase [uncultured Polaribacter sp.]|uniref:family 20 glycosylhydrolase n=1 Tax=uncultured Polaribacter sp. TaxID=174711 RepID=UPI002630BB57|nr:family 20 glycosylhydrolase [uncultured Polaribacter sp.]
MLLVSLIACETKKPAIPKDLSKQQLTTNQGGFFTQEEYKDIVKYGQDRFVTIVLEKEKTL